MFDLIVLGTGSAGLSAAYPLAAQGWKVAVADERPFGGTCALRGCDPKKVLVGAAEAVDWLRRLGQVGVISSSATINWQKLAAFKTTFVDEVPQAVERGLKEAGIATFHGSARFIDKNTIEVDGQKLQGKNILIATGATPAQLGIVGEEYVTLSDDFLDLQELPRKIVFIGGGYISFEFAHISQRAGAEVTILHRSERVLNRFDSSLVDLLVKESRELGIKIEFNTPVVEVEKKGSALIVQAKQGGEIKSFEADLVVHGGGRVPNLEGLNLAKIGVEYSARGVKVNEYLQSTVSNIYAAGDAAESGLPLTPVAGKEGSLVAHHLLNQEQDKVLFREVPSVVFTIPPLASVGLTEEEAAKAGFDFTVKTEMTSGWYSSKRINEKYSGYKTLVEKKSGRILGAHLLGHGAEEIINLFALAIDQGLVVSDLKRLVYSFPSRSSDIEYMV